MALTIIFLIAWYLTGFLPSRRINKQRNRLHSWGIGSKIYGFVDGDNGILPWTSLPYPFTKPLFRASWSQIMIGNKSDLPPTNSIGHTITYSEPRKIHGVRGYLIDVSDTTNKIRKNNKQVLDIDIQFPDSGLGFEITLGTVFIVTDPMKYLDLEEGILTYSNREVKDVLNTYLIEKEADWRKTWEALKAEQIDASVATLSQKQSFGIYVVSEMEKLRLGDMRNEVEIEGKPFEEYLDEEKFDQFGFKFGELSYELGYGEDVKALKEARQKQQKTIEEANTAVENEKLQDIRRTTQKNNATAQATADQTRWVVGKKIVDDVAAAQERVNAAYKANFLVLPQDSKQQNLQNLVTSMGLLEFTKSQNKKEATNENE
ncbi:hypothetical protein IT401_00475 [Candidatus Nomurabacteria bacterium]|nr:hypothetical protein [Candidatus Nomurabacteria bacterium]